MSLRSKPLGELVETKDLLRLVQRAQRAGRLRPQVEKTPKQTPKQRRNMRAVLLVGTQGPQTEWVRHRDFRGF